MGELDEFGKMSETNLSNGKGKLADEDQAAMKASHSSDTNEASAETFEDLLRLCGEAGRWQLKVKPRTNPHINQTISRAGYLPIMKTSNPIKD